jgi:hypothetical protein
LKTKASRFTRFLVLVPHRDLLKPLGEYRRRLFAAGLEGAWSFPAVVPLGVLSRPLGLEELKALARSFRDASLEDGRQGWFRAGDCVTGPFPPGPVSGALSLYGFPLDLPLPFLGENSGDLPPGGPGDKLAYCFPRPILAAALVRQAPDGPSLPAPPPLAFRAAALANMVLRPLPAGDRDFSFEWRIGKPAWLPPVKGGGG